MSKLRVLSHTVTVQEVGQEAFSSVDQVGETNNRLGTISLLTGLYPDARAQTLLHEILHFIETTNGLDFEEYEIDSLATGIFSVLKDNPGFVETYIKTGHYSA